MNVSQTTVYIKLIYLWSCKLQILREAKKHLQRKMSELSVIFL